MKQSAWILMGLVLCGCAFEKAEEAVENPLMSVNAAVVWTEGSGEKSISRTERRTLLVNGEKSWTLDRAVTFPVSPPDQVGFVFVLPLDEAELRSVKEGRIRAFGRLSNGVYNGPTEPRDRPLFIGDGLKVESTESGLARLTVPIIHLHELLPEETQKILRFTVVLRDLMGSDLLQIMGQLQTPPSVIQINQRTLKEYLDQEEALPEHMTSLESELLNLTLIQVVTVTNFAQLPVEISFPSKPDAALTTRVEKRTYQDQGCSYKIDYEDQEKDLGQRLYLLPEKGLEDEFELQASAPQLDREIRVFLAPNESTRVGIYASGGTASDLANGIWPKSDFITTKVKNRCFWWCKGGKDGAPGSRPFCFKCNRWDYAQAHMSNCNRCHDTEPVGGHIGATFCYARWINSREMVDATVGVRSHPVFLKMPADRVSLDLRWQDSRESREVSWPFPETVQAE